MKQQDLVAILREAEDSTIVTPIQMDESSSSDHCNREWCSCISTRNKKSIECKMLVAGPGVAFIIDTGTSMNMLPVKYAKYSTEPYSGMLKIWNEVDDNPTGTCRMKVTNLSKQ